MNVGEPVVLVEDIEGVAEGTHGRVKDLSADSVMVECKVRDRLTVVHTHTWELLPERLWKRLSRRRRPQN
jgi:hypothetical protein